MLRGELKPAVFQGPNDRSISHGNLSSRRTEQPEELALTGGRDRGRDKGHNPQVAGKQEDDGSAKYIVKPGQTIQLGHDLQKIVTQQPSGYNILKRFDNYIVQEIVMNEQQPRETPEIIAVIAASTHVGYKRANQLNQDRSRYARIEGLPENEEQVIALTPDGIGGYIGGHIAASIAVGGVTGEHVQNELNFILSTMARSQNEPNFIQLQRDYVFKGIPGWYQEIIQNSKAFQNELALETGKKYKKAQEAGADIRTWAPDIQEVYLAVAAQKVNQEIFELNKRAALNMGTTLPVALVRQWKTEQNTVESTAYIANAGDTRVYLYRNGQLTQITKDDSTAQEEVNDGRIDQDKLYDYLPLSLLTNSLGNTNEDLDINTYAVPLQQGDKLLLCTDGLWALVQERSYDKRMTNVIHESIAQGGEPWRIVGNLVNAALNAGGRDNITGLLMEIPSMRQAKQVSETGTQLSPSVHDQLLQLDPLLEQMKNLYGEIRRMESTNPKEANKNRIAHRQIGNEFIHNMLRILSDESNASFREHPNIRALYQEYLSVPKSKQREIEISLRKETARLIEQIKSEKQR